jgi:acetylornithine deacetylase
LASKPPSHHPDEGSKILRRIDRLVPDLTRFIQTLVRSESVTGDEEAVQGIARDKLTQMGAEVDYWCPRPEDFEGHEAFIAREENVGRRPNVVGRFKGKASVKTLAFNGHVDVVPEGDPSSWRYPPYGATVAGGKLYGRGACDMKAGLASCIFAIESLIDSGVPPKNDILVESVIGEESGGMGTLATILRGYVPDATIIAEPTSLELAIAQAGCLMFRIVIKGRAAHGASRYMGVSAVEKFQPVLDALQALEGRRMSSRRLPLYAGIPNPVPLSVGTVAAGTWDSTVPETLVAEGRYGVWPGEALDEAKSMFEDALAAASAKDDWLARNPPQVTWFGPQWESASLARDHWLVKLVQTSCRHALGRAPKVCGTTGGTDMRLFTNLARKPALIYGPGDDSTAHFSNENVEIKDVVKACKVYAMAALAWNE